MGKPHATKRNIAKKLLQKTKSILKTVTTWVATNSSPQTPTSAAQHISAAQRNIERAPPFSEFHRFSELPAELRLIIWKLALPCGKNGQLLYPIILRDPAKGPGRYVNHIPYHCFEIQTNAGSKSPMSCDIKGIGISGANKESRVVYLEAFTKSSTIYKGVLRYPPGAIFAFGSFNTLFLPWYTCEYNLNLVKREAMQLLGTVDHAAVFVYEFRYLKARRDGWFRDGRGFHNKDGIADEICQLGFERISILGEENRHRSYALDCGWSYDQEYAYMKAETERGVLDLRADLDELKRKRNDNFKIPVIDHCYEDHTGEESRGLWR
ncbi:uncharacterized protein PAC_14986 [Phialocephala subalpina]|uniref:2EXR domain-containing protein n=1 Tax=Phialocephala subalpina TaxID=576137 RepID=A0A1L7XJH0_9HELO|nr:uncharacterized protein PAC_14986 [Phialocephala subalpina]